MKKKLSLILGCILFVILSVGSVPSSSDSVFWSRKIVTEASNIFQLKFLY